MNLSKITGKYVGQSFEKCNCMELVYNWFSDLEIKLPDKYKDLDLYSYMDNWEKDKKGTIKTMLELFRTLGTEVNIKKIKKYDLLAVQEKGNIYAAIAIGVNTIITSHINKGVKVSKLGKYHKVILARRLI